MDRLGNKKSPEETQKLNIENYKPLYTAPKLFNGLISGQKKIKHKLFKSELFSLGMILLEVFVGSEEIQEVYDYQKEVFSYKRLQEII